jgi:hypothetical protein
VPHGVDVDLLGRDAYRHQILLVRGATFCADNANDPHIRFNVVFAQQPRLGDYLKQCFAAFEQARSTLARAGHAAKGS